MISFKSFPFVKDKLRQKIDATEIQYKIIEVPEAALEKLTIFPIFIATAPAAILIPRYEEIILICTRFTFLLRHCST